MQIIELNRCR